MSKEKELFIFTIIGSGFVGAAIGDHFGVCFLGAIIGYLLGFWAASTNQAKNKP